MADKEITRRAFLSISTMTAAVLVLDWNQVSAGPAPAVSPKDHPVVVIGAGLGGLFCGAYLAKQGFPVTMIERHSIPGGYATSFDRARGRFTFDVSLHRTSLNVSMDRMFKRLGLHRKIETIRIPDDARYITPDDDMTLRNDPGALIHDLSMKYPGEAKGIKACITGMSGIVEELESLKRNGRPSNFARQYPGLWDIRDKTLASFLDTYVKNPALKDILAFGWGAYGLPPSRLAAFYYIIATSGYRKKGLYYIKPRSQALSDALAESIENSGGTIHYQTRADKIRVKNKAVCGVTTDSGQTLPAKYVVSNASAMTTLYKMLPQDTLPTEFRKKIHGFKPSISTFTVWLGLNRDLTQTVKDCRVVISSGRGAEADYVSCLKGEIHKVSFSVTLYDNYFKGYSAPGTSTLTIITLSGFAPWKKYESDYHAGRKGRYRKEKQRWADTLVRKLEKRLIPGLSSMIGVMEAATPLTNRRYTGNTAGAIYGYEQSIDNSFMNRIRNKIPVKGLYLAGAWGNPGGGYGGALRGGQRTYHQIMEDLGGRKARELS